MNIKSQRADRLNHALTHCRKLNRKRLKEGKVKGYVYLIRCHSFVKIGFTTSNPSLRLNAMQTGCPYELSLLKYWLSDDCVRLESRLHAQFSRFNERLEWFQIPDEILEQLQKIDPHAL